MEREEALSHSPAPEDQCLLASPDPSCSGHPTDIIRANHRENGKQIGNYFFFPFLFSNREVGKYVHFNVFLLISIFHPCGQCCNMLYYSSMGLGIAYFGSEKGRREGEVRWEEKRRKNLRKKVIHRQKEFLILEELAKKCVMLPPSTHEMYRYLKML